ncbi:beta-ketoacyl synthase N-terminal-like domain-containing protein [uncultured Roseobacter sp.]|uniref:beta-ketoacyl synthase N-terminal-like domain-containing protein n=1 Tax=uncultured Roseobacter sp. TaxID=114847 RepID=UPI0026257318|nr:beta-ketoacyl synthase N-terminal-like domain-containing protein [uncultured Roseobacter sp.]
MSDTIIISGSIADLPQTASPTVAGYPAATDGQTAFGFSGLQFLDHTDFDALPARQRGRLTRPYARLSQMISRLLAQTGLSPSDIAGQRTGLVSGSMFGCSQVYEIHARLRHLGPRGVDAIRFAQATHSYPISACAIDFQIQGPCFAVVNTQAASLQALLCAWDWLRDGRCDRVLVAAYEDFTAPVSTHLAHRARATPGLVFGESMVLVMLERDSLATRAKSAPVLLDVAAGQPTDSARACGTMAVDHLGAEGLLALHRSISIPEPAPDGAQIRLPACPAGIAVTLAFNAMELC